HGLKISYYERYERPSPFILVHANQVPRHAAGALLFLLLKWTGTTLGVKDSDKVYFCDGRRSIILGQRHYRRFLGQTAQKSWIKGNDSEIRSLSQCGSGDDESLSTRRSVRDGRWRG